MLKDIKHRLKGPTPSFFKKLRKKLNQIGGSFMGLGGALIAIPATVAKATGQPFELPALTSAGAICLVVGGVIIALGSFLTSLPIDDKNEGS